MTKTAAYQTTRRIALCLLLGLTPASVLAQQSDPFRLEESTIADIRNAIKAGQITCQGVVQAYSNRFPGPCRSA